MKVRANELRIGNILQGDEIPIVNQGIYSDGIYAITGYGISELEKGRLLKAEPIPLTEEWLLKLRSRESMPVKYKDIYIMLDRFLLTYQASYGFWYVYDFSGEEMLYITKVEFVHEWQNVYFALNGEELTLTEHPTPAS